MSHMKVDLHSSTTMMSNKEFLFHEKSYRRFIAKRIFFLFFKNKYHWNLDQVYCVICQKFKLK